MYFGGGIIEFNVIKHYIINTKYLYLSILRFFMLLCHCNSI